jgi:hypothetical protein
VSYSKEKKGNGEKREMKALAGLEEANPSK